MRRRAVNGPRNSACAGDRKDRIDQRSLRPICRCRDPARQRHQDLHQAARRHGCGKEDRAYSQRCRRACSGHCQAFRAGAGGARQRGSPRRFCAHSECARRRRRIGAGEEIHGRNERGDLGDHHQVALHDSYLGDPAAGDGDFRHLGRQQRNQAVLHHGVRLRAGTRRRGGVSTGVQEGRRRDRGICSISGGQSGFLGLCPACEGPQSAMHLHLCARRSAAGCARQGPGRAQHRPEQDQSAWLGRNHQRAGSQVHGRLSSRHDLCLALRLQEHRTAESGVRASVQPNAWTQS